MFDQNASSYKKLTVRNGIQDNYVKWIQREDVKQIMHIADMCVTHDVFEVLKEATNLSHSL